MWPKNLPLKLTALGLAFLLWFHVATNREYDYPISMNLSVTEVPNGFSLAQPLPSNIKLLLHGSGKELVRLLWTQGRVGLLLEPWMEGPYPVSTDHIVVESNVEVSVKQILEPALFEVHLDTVVQRQVPVHFLGEYSTAAGKALVRTPEVDPPFVLLIGPRSQVNRIQTVGIKPLQLDILDASMKVEAGLDLKDTYGVNAAPGKVHVQFEVADSRRLLVEDIAIAVPRGWTTEPSAITLNVAAAQSRLDELTSDAIRVSVSPGQTLESGAFVTVQATVPPLVQILSVTPERVKLIRP